MSVDWTAVIVALVENGFVLIMAILSTIVFPYILGKVKDQRLQTALGELLNNVGGVVARLQNTVVEGMKEKSADGKLSKEDIKFLTDEVVNKAKEITPDAMLKTIENSKVDILSYIMEHLDEILDVVKATKE